MPTIWLLFTPAERELTSPARRTLREMCTELEWSFVDRPVREVKDIHGRPIHLLPSRDLNDLYRAAHRDLLAVVDTAFARSLLDPREDSRPSAQRTMSLARLVAYKALYFGARTPLDSTALANVANTLRAYVEQASEPLVDTDPRALPFPVFDLGRFLDNDLALESEEGRAEFEKNFGPERARVDTRGINWNLDRRAYHGRDALSVRGQTLPPGIHWDVPGPRGGTHITTATEVWHLKRDQYLNIYPDMYVRTTREGGRRVWPQNR